MKTKKIQNLSLRKETIANLENKVMKKVLGGDIETNDLNPCAPVTDEKYTCPYDEEGNLCHNIITG